jgi:hypothetical protein
VSICVKVVAIIFGHQIQCTNEFGLGDHVIRLTSEAG